MNFGTFSQNPYYVKYESSLKQLHRLIAESQGESKEAHALRDQMDDLGEQLNRGEIQRLQGLSGDLFTLHAEEVYDSDESNEWTPTVLRDALKAAWRHNDRQRILELLRKGPLLSISQTAFLRGRSYAELGHADTALLFINYAALQDPSNASYKILALELYRTSGRSTEAARLAEAYIHAASSSLSLKIEAASVLHSTTKKMDEVPARRINEMIVQVLDRPLSQRADGEPSETPSFMLVFGFIVLGLCFEGLNKESEALRAYNAALKLEPENDLVLSSRGLLLRDTDPQQAKSDFEHAIQNNTGVIWPYLFVARYSLVHGELRRCLDICDKIMSMSADPVIVAEAWQWGAIAGFHLGFPDSLVETAFKNALAFDPLNEHIQNNYERFQTLRQTAIRSETVPWDNDEEDVAFERAREQLDESLASRSSVVAAMAN